MKCQILFSKKNKKNISKYCLLKVLPSMQCVKVNMESVRTICQESSLFSRYHLK